MLVALGLTLSAPRMVLAAEPVPRWGGDAHRIICEIAFLDMNEGTRAKVRALLATDRQFSRFSDSCSWADDIRTEVRAGVPAYQRFARLTDAHFVNFPRAPTPLDPRACTRVVGGVRNPCVIDAIREYSDSLRRSPSPKGRLEALLLLAHFVGDVHQPLHAGYGDDRGGNSVAIVLPDGTRTNLHAVWDAEVIEQAMGSRRWQTYATELRGKVTASERRQWSDLDPFTWARESYALVQRQVYAGIGQAPSGAERRVGADYLRFVQPAVELRLKQAGIRLARLLEQVLGG